MLEFHKDGLLERLAQLDEDADLQLNPGNVNAWLKHGNSEKLSLNNARMMLRYVEQCASRRA